MDTRKRIDELFDEAVSLRRYFHENPELSEAEATTALTVSEFLTKHGISHEQNIGGHGIVAIVSGKGQISENQPFKTIGIRADMDALPIEENVAVPFKSKNKGVMHACGHDIHTAILLVVAKIFKEMESTLCGNVKFFFEPAEETIGGAQGMIENGCLENPHVDAVLGIHIAPAVKVGKVEFRRGKMNAASTEFEMTVSGVSCHGAHPENGVDSIVAASNIICGLQSIITRNLAPTNPGIITIGQIRGGNKNNVVANETTLSGIIRALDNNTRDYIKERVKLLSEQIACGFNATAKVDFIDSYPALVNDDDLGEIIEKTAEQYLSREKLCFLPEPSLGADDFSYFSEATQSLYFNIGCLGDNEDKLQMLHNEYLNPHEECIRVGMIMEVFGVLNLLKERR